MAGRSARGTGTIRKKTVTRGGKKYEYWEARYTAGADPGTGKQIQRSITGKTQKEVAQKLRDATAVIDNGTYTAPNKQTLGQWLDVWAGAYLGSVKPRTVDLYNSYIRVYIKPALGAVRLENLNTHTIQGFYNTLAKEGKEIRTKDKRGKVTVSHGPLAPKTVKNVHGVLHKALQQAVLIGYLHFNPADACTLPRIERKELAPLDDLQITAFLKEIQGNSMEALFTVTLFTGLREGEVMGLMWDCVDFEAGTITINKQLQRLMGGGGEYRFVSPKNGKSRVITPAASVMALLKRHRAAQAAQRLRAGKLCGRIPALCSQTSWATTWHRRRFTAASRRQLPPLDGLTPAFTICAILTPWRPFAPGMILRRSRRRWDTLQRPLHWIFMPTLPHKCGRPVPPVWTPISRAYAAHKKHRSCGPNRTTWPVLFTSERGRGACAAAVV